MSEKEKDNKELKSKIEVVIMECFKLAKRNNFSDLNFVFLDEKSELNFLKDKLKIFNKLDIYSRTFLSIHTRAKVALYELKTDDFGASSLELLRLVLTLPEVLNSETLKSVKISEKEIMNVSRSLENYRVGKEIKKSAPIRENTMLVKSGLTGKAIQKAKQKEEDELAELNEINFEDFENEESNNDDFSDIKL